MYIEYVASPGRGFNIGRKGSFSHFKKMKKTYATLNRGLKGREGANNVMYVYM